MGLREDSGRSLVVQLKAARDHARNDRTQVLQRTIAPRSRGNARDFAELFRRHYAAIRRTCEQFARLGVAAIAIDVERSAGTDVVATACVAAHRDRLASLVVGRHGLCDLFLDGDPRLSLRHLALVVRAISDDEVRMQLLDLRTGLAFEDEHGRPLEALVAEGPVFVRVGRYALMLLVSGDGIPWPDDPEEGWLCIPERVYLRESPAEPDRWLRRRPQRPPAEVTDGGQWRRDPARRGAGVPEALPPALAALPRERRADAQTLVQALPGPSRLGVALVQPDEPPIGQLRVAAGEERYRIPLGATAARQGVLIGRYERCDVGELSGLDDSRLSRVHLLVLLVGDKLYAIDTASTNGTFLGANAEREVRIAELVAGSTLVLGDNIAEVRWVPADAASRRDAAVAAPG